MLFIISSDFISKTPIIVEAHFQLYIEETNEQITE